jgi:predicted XRE-type DNA-binding protein
VSVKAPLLEAVGGTVWVAALATRGLRGRATRGLPGLPPAEGDGVLSVPKAEEMLKRAKIGFHVYKLRKARNLKQREIAALLKIKQPEVSHLMNGHFNRFTTDKLLDFLRRLDRKVTFQIIPHNPGEPYQEVGFGLYSMIAPRRDATPGGLLERTPGHGALLDGSWRGDRLEYRDRMEKPNLGHDAKTISYGDDPCVLRRSSHSRCVSRLGR